MTENTEHAEELPAEQLKLNLGGGPIKLPGFINVDRKLGGEVYPLRIPNDPDYQTNLAGVGAKFHRSAAGSEWWTLPENSVDEIRASHVLEHIPHTQSLDAIREWVRALKPGGRMRLAVPDLVKWVNLYTAGNTDLPLLGYLFGGQTDGDDFHKAAFDAKSLSEMMVGVGLNDIRPWVSDIPDCAAMSISLNLEGFKREPRPVKGVAAVISKGRLGITAHEHCIHAALTPLGIPLTIGTGAYWSHALTIGMEGAVKKGCKYILTLDHDTVFDRNDVEDLFWLMEIHPDVDALCAMQMRRSGESALLTIKGEDGQNIQRVETKMLKGDLLKVNTGHFGLTMIRASSLAKCKKPWFCETPDDSGSWGEGRVDADIAFWRQWEASGLNVSTAVHVKVGHIMEMVSWANKGLEPIYQHVNEYIGHGRPTGVLSR